MAGWLLPASFLFSLLTFSAAVTSGEFENTAIVRTVDLGGSLVHVTTTYAVKVLEPDVATYAIALGNDEMEKASWLEARVKGGQEMLTITDPGTTDGEEGYRILEIVLPKPAEQGSTLNLVVETTQTHATFPWPATAKQGDDQALKYSTDLFVLSPYNTLVQRTKLKSSTPTIHSYSTPEGVASYIADDLVTKSGSTVTYGPFNNVDASTSPAFLTNVQQKIEIHYNHDLPVLAIDTLSRSVEISHWGANLNIENTLSLRNAGPELKGHFSRLEHQSQAFYHRQTPHVFPGIALHLPPGIKNAYYYDLVGNVSTSHLRVAPSIPGSKRQLTSILELRPRFPLFGGWNYSFTFGWDAPLRDSVGYDRESGKYVARIPVVTEFPTAVINEAELKIVLPEGATDVDFVEPFPARSTEYQTRVTYLDTTGRPAIIFKYKNLTDRHARPIFVSYKLSLSAHLKKPFAVASVLFALFTVGLFAKRVDLTLRKKPV